MRQKIIELILIALTFVVLLTALFAACNKEDLIYAGRMESFFKQERRMKEYIIQVSENDR